jgi:hypothetical protein
MSELERDLRALGRQIEYPPTPHLATRVAARLRTPRRTPARLRLGQAIAVTAASVIVCTVTILAASRDVADALLDAYGLAGVTVEHTDEPAPAPAPRRLDLGSRTSLERAARRLPFAPLLPRLAGGPDEVHVNEGPPGAELSLVYHPRRALPPAITTGTGLLVTEFRGDLAPEYLTKLAPQATTVRRLRVGGDRAIWIAGAPHYFLYDRPGGGIAERDLQIAQNVLLIERGDVLVRMEGAFNLTTAERLAGTLAAFRL